MWPKFTCYLAKRSKLCSLYSGYTWPKESFYTEAVAWMSTLQKQSFKICTSSQLLSAAVIQVLIKSCIKRNNQCHLVYDIHSSEAIQYYVVAHIAMTLCRPCAAPKKRCQWGYYPGLIGSLHREAVASARHKWASLPVHIACAQSNGPLIVSLPSGKLIRVVDDSSIEVKKTLL